MRPANPDGTLYAWTATDKSGCGSCGITTEPGAARRRAWAALAALSPGASGVIEEVVLDQDARQPAYVHGRVVARLNRFRDAVREADGGEPA
ncbi:hypothetical protein [Nonomuraea sp. NPDC049709]|uniref:hypothetical protein n=1 Tax=Nonomuraea sp. NPDC049709 TaxID=3154736 RepID=UPI00342AD1F1